jgi:hypothetical protein
MSGAGIAALAMDDLTPNQLRLLRELDFYGGVLILRRRLDEADYAVLEKSGFVTAFAINVREVRYKITPAGRGTVPSLARVFRLDPIEAPLIRTRKLALGAKKFTKCIK